MNDTELLDFIQRNEAWLTHSQDDAGTDHEWRCQVSARTFPTPDIRERSAQTGYGKTAREAIDQCKTS